MNKDPMAVALGSRGGNATKKKRGVDFYKKIGMKGHLARKKKKALQKG